MNGFPDKYWCEQCRSATENDPDYRDHCWVCGMSRDGYQHLAGTPRPEGGTLLRSSFPGWMRNTQLFNGWLNRCNPRMWTAHLLIHARERRRGGQGG